MGFLSGLIGGVGSAIASGLFGKSSDEASDAGVQSVTAGSTPPPPHQPAPAEVTGSQSLALIRENAAKILSGSVDALSSSAVSTVSRALSPSASSRGRDQRAYLDAAFPELNAWEKSGASATGFGQAQSEQDQAYKLAQEQMDNQKDIAKIQADTQLKVAGIQSQTAIANTKDQVFAQNEMLRFNQDKTAADTRYIIENTKLNKEQQANLIVERALSRARIDHVNVDASLKSRMIDEVTSRISKIDADTVNAKYASSKYGAIAKDIVRSIYDIGPEVVDFYKKATGVQSVTSSKASPPREPYTITVNPKYKSD